MRNYGVVVRPGDFTVDEKATEELRQRMRSEREGRPRDDMTINRGGTIRELLTACEEETGLKPPRLQWEANPYGPHVGLPYVKEWYRKMREQGMEIFDAA